MKKIIGLIIGLSMMCFLMMIPTFCYSVEFSYKQMLNSKMMYTWEKLMMHSMVKDWMWLAITKPKSLDALENEISFLKYKVDGPNDKGVKSPSLTFNEGGDCEDLTLFVISRFMQLNVSSIGFIILSPEKATENCQAHIAAISKNKDGSILVIDGAMGPPGTSRLCGLNRYLAHITRSNTQMKYYKIHWLFEDNSYQTIRPLR